MTPVAKPVLASSLSPFSLDHPVFTDFILLPSGYKCSFVPSANTLHRLLLFKLRFDGFMFLCLPLLQLISIFIVFVSVVRFFTTTVKQISPQWDNKSSESESKRSKRKELTVMHLQTLALGVAAGAAELSASLILGVA